MSSSTPTLTSSSSGHWTVVRHLELPSTNPAAAPLPAWHAVIAAKQTGGYGRTGRGWVSGHGGLWLSATLPTPGPAKQWETLPLCVGATLAGVLHDLGVSKVRLRWPNDLMVGDRKVAGLLMERHHPDRVVVGLGLNVLNDPAHEAPELAAVTTSLCQHWAFPRSLFELSELVLNSLATMHARFSRDGFAPFAEEITARWLQPRTIEIFRQEQGPSSRHFLRGIDAEGRLLADDEFGQPAALDAVQVHLLREVA